MINDGGRGCWFYRFSSWIISSQQYLVICLFPDGWYAKNLSLSQSYDGPVLERKRSWYSFPKANKSPSGETSFPRLTMFQTCGKLEWVFRHEKEISSLSQRNFRPLARFDWRFCIAAEIGSSKLENSRVDCD